MKNLQESIDGITEHYIELYKNIDKLFRINLEMLQKENFEKYLYREAKLVEDMINALDVKIKEVSIMSITRFQPAAGNLKALITFIKSNKMLERIVDLVLDTVVLMRKVKNRRKYRKRFWSIRKYFEKNK